MRQTLVSTTIMAVILLGVIAAWFFWPDGLSASDPDLDLESMKQHAVASLQEKSHVHSRSSDFLADSANKRVVYTYRDGNRVIRVTRQDGLTVQPSGMNTPDDVVLHRGTLHSIVESQPDKHGPDSQPVFRSESGGGLMSLPGGVLLLLDSSWTEDEVQSFFATNGIPQDSVSPLGFLTNGYMVATSPGFHSLDLANSLAGQDGVVVSSPNWWREVEAR